MVKQSNKQLIQKLKFLGLVSDTNVPLLYNNFKNRATIMGFPKKRFIIFIGIPKKNLFAFYVPTDSHPEMMKDAYKRYLKLVAGKMDDYNDKVIQWGNCGIPLDYLPLRTETQK